MQESISVTLESNISFVVTLFRTGDGWEKAEQLRMAMLKVSGELAAGGEAVD